MTIRTLRLGFLAAGILLPVVWLAAQTSVSPREQLIRYLDGIAKTQLDARAASVAQIKTRADADRRKTAVREKILNLIGGLPDHKGGVAVKEFGSVSAEGFRVEKIAYESLPGFWVTADLYVPTGAGPFPAIVLAPGHGAGGKTENWSWGGNFARNGMMVLAYDPIGQGERLQYYDADQKKSFIGNPTGEHGEANVGPMLIGDDIARYMVNDAMRGVDYLAARKDVDSARIGAFGCSGGGTSTAYFAALDDRVKVAATACYITSFGELLPSPTGAQDAEQSIPHFIAQGLDFADWVEAFAPKPYAVVSTQDDMFPFEGARQTVDEVKRFYGLYSASDNIQWITGPGVHGNLGPISPAIMAFFVKNLKGGSGDSTFAPIRAAQASDMIVTPSGQVSTAMGGETVYSINRKRAESLTAHAKVLSSKAEVSRLQTQIRKDIRSLTGATIEPGSAHTEVTVQSTAQRDGYRIDTIAMTSDAGTVVAGLAAIPDGSKPKPAILMLDTASTDTATAKHSDFVRLAEAGNIVVYLQPRPT
ncbi:MAG TPA: acetylxylan esterase, partial [Terriglobia bacterium]|nr:acetylxylan esterase [Terriglobia bacterium]